MRDRETQLACNQLKSTKSDARVSLIMDLLDSNCCRSLDLDELSARCNLSRSRVQHLFKEHTGTTPSHHLKQIKLAKAREMLEQSFYSVKQIASIVGVSDLSHFVRDYKLRFGQTPTETRRQRCRAIDS